MNTDEIDTITKKLICITERIHPFNGSIISNTDMCNLWLDLYFPLVMDANQIYGCEIERTQQLAHS